jgi:hypothetical protein
MDILNVFTQDAFGLVSLTEAINDITPQYGRLGAMGLFVDEPGDQRTVAVDFDPITMQLLPQSRWGGPGVANKSSIMRTRSYSIPHFPINDQVLANDLQGRRMAGGNQAQTSQYQLAKRLREMKIKLEQTLEWMRLGVLKAGQVKDGQGNLILDIYADFGITQTTTSFALGTPTTDVMGKIAAIKRTILQNLRGELMSTMVAVVSDGFYDALVSHANVKAAFTYYQNNGQNLANDYSGASVQNPNAAGLVDQGVQGFYYGGVTWVNYTGFVTDSTGASQPLIDANAGYVFPLGTRAFKTFYAPADYNETVNTEAVPFYAKQRPLEFDKGIEIECQQNPLPLCLKPALVQRVTT